MKEFEKKLRKYYEALKNGETNEHEDDALHKIFLYGILGGSIDSLRWTHHIYSDVIISLLKELDAEREKNKSVDPESVKDAKEFFKVEYKSKKSSGDGKTQECYSKEPKSHTSGSVFVTDNNGKSYTKLGDLDGDYPFSVAIDYTKDDKSKKDECDAVDHPSHYTFGSVECIDGIRSALGEDGFKAFCRGNAIKYLWRAGHKDGEPAEKDLKKANWYINKWLGGENEKD